AALPDPPEPLPAPPLPPRRALPPPARLPPRLRLPLPPGFLRPPLREPPPRGLQRHLPPRRRGGALLPRGRPGPPGRENGGCRETCDPKGGDGTCDRECNTPACGWDGGDCALRVGDPWGHCRVPECPPLFTNGRCDPRCDTPPCLYDNFECHPPPRACNPLYEQYCADHFGDGRCDQGCASEECGWDGLDCAQQVPEALAQGVLVVTVLLPPEELRRASAAFLQRLSAILRTSLRFRLHPDGRYMIQPYYRPRRLRRREVAPEVIGSVATLEMDNRLCARGPAKCFPDTRSAADYLGALSALERLHLPYPVTAVRGDKLPEEPAAVGLLPLVGVGGVILLAIAVLGVLVARRRREQSTLWLPEGFSLAKEGQRGRREPVGQDALGMKPMGKGETLMGAPPEEWPDGDCPEAKRLKVGEAQPQDPVDSRQWTQSHLVAADIRVPPATALTPPQGDFDSDCLDVNVRGPDGFTPLMLASFCGASPEAQVAEEEEGEEASAGIIGDLICQGANLGAQTDRTGETALHLAARYARADAAKRLLDAGADPNAQDKAGRTPLHAAVTADAQGVFQILIRNRSTDLDARTGDGSTALMLAARLAVEGLVEELVACHADVNAVDESGKSALHWAAAVNNVEATRALLRGGANKDLQDGKEETPLFLAAREGSLEAARLLLAHGANRELSDHLERPPRAVARQRLHRDLVRLLEEPPPAPGGGGAPFPPPSPPPSPPPRPPPAFPPPLPPPAKKSRRSG
ncbi:neurogenic locus notch homolog protein 3-like, partial [Larus michahellis]|uniref:neurogenic locus notch homolog protein 3-like n=1 Tax=Larus michahellis TaxID=119627 RepID=UPI003D9BCC69